MAAWLPRLALALAWLGGAGGSALAAPAALASPSSSPSAVPNAERAAARATSRGAASGRSATSPYASPGRSPAARSGAEDASGEREVALARAVRAAVRDSSMRVRMRVVGHGADERVSTLRGYEKLTDAGRRILWIFDSPLELAGTGFLAWHEGRGPDELWLYLPGQRRVRRVPPGLRREGFQGSLFTYEDLSAVLYLDGVDRAWLVEPETECAGGPCALVECSLEPGRFAYQRLRVWLRRRDHLPARIEFYGERLLKVLRVLRAERIDGVPTALEMEMSRPGDAYRTRVELSDVRYNQGLEDSLFTVARLSRSGR